MANGDFPDGIMVGPLCWSCEKGVNCTRGRRGAWPTGTTLKGIWDEELRNIVPVLGWLGRRKLLVCCVNPGRLIALMVLREEVGGEGAMNVPSDWEEGPLLGGLLCSRWEG